jgi:hypothetical protein
MAIDRAMYSILMDENTKEVESQCFSVTPGSVVEILGFGFADEAMKIDIKERTVPQEAYLEQLLFKESVRQPRLEHMHEVREGVTVYTLGDFYAAIREHDYVRVNGCCQALSKCNNIMIIAVPGDYRFVLNDESAIGNVRIYMRAYSKDDYPWSGKMFS